MREGKDHEGDTTVRIEEEERERVRTKIDARKEAGSV